MHEREHGGKALHRAWPLRVRASLKRKIGREAGRRLLARDRAARVPIRAAGIGGPVPACEADALRRLSGGDADRFGQKRWWDLGGELCDGCGPGGAGLDADAAESVGDGGWVDRPVGSSGGEQPASLEVISRALAPADGQLPYEAGEGLGEIDLVPLEVNRRLPLGLRGDLIDRESGDAGEGLGVEDDEGAGDAVIRADGVIGDQPSGSAARSTRRRPSNRTSQPPRTCPAAQH